jgi:hypothetical protein
MMFLFYGGRKEGTQNAPKWRVSRSGRTCSHGGVLGAKASSKANPDYALSGEEM